LLPALAAAPVVHAETLYVVEQLVINVNSAPDASGERVATIKSGDAVEVLDKQGEQIHVHLANGTEGWVRKSYLSGEPPLRLKLNERTAEIDELKQDVARLQDELASARGAGGRGKPAAQQASTDTNSRGNATVEPGSAARANSAPVTTAAHVSDAPNASAPAAADPAADPAAGEPSYFMTPPEEPARPVWHWALGSFVIALGLGFASGWQVLDRRIRRKYGGLRIY
jgi:uncharacterized protein YgiM (DUF1202 family)